MLGKSPFGWASRSHFWPSQRMAQPKFKKNWLGQLWLGQIFGWAIIGPAKVKKNLAGPIMAGPNFWLGQSMTQPLAQPKWPSHNTCPAKLAQPKYGPATWPSQNWASSQTLAQPKSGKNWPSQKSGPAIIGPAKFLPSHNVEKIGPAKIWPSHKWPSQILAQPKFGKNWPSQNLAGPILAAGPVLGFSPTLLISTCTD